MSFNHFGLWGERLEQDEKSKEECPYKGVVGETALTFDASAIVFFVVGDSILISIVQESRLTFP